MGHIRYLCMCRETCRTYSMKWQVLQLGVSCTYPVRNRAVASSPLHVSASQMLKAGWSWIRTARSSWQVRQKLQHGGTTMQELLACVSHSAWVWTDQAALKCLMLEECSTVGNGDLTYLMYLEHLQMLLHPFPIKSQDSASEFLFPDTINSPFCL